MSAILNDALKDESFTLELRKKIKEDSNKSNKTVYKLISTINKLNVKQLVNQHKFTKIWLDRNYYYSGVFASSLELDHLVFQQYVFIEDTKELSLKLERIGFVEQNDYPDEVHFKDFTRMMYNTQYNIALSLYKPQYKKAIYLANDIVNESATSGQIGLSVFLSSIHVLISQ